MELLQAGKSYTFGCFGNQSFTVIATHKNEAWVYWHEDDKTQVVPIEKDELAEVVND